jgi:hypothetical protein
MMKLITLLVLIVLLSSCDPDVNQQTQTIQNLYPNAISIHIIEDRRAPLATFIVYQQCEVRKVTISWNTIKSDIKLFNIVECGGTK